MTVPPEQPADDVAAEVAAAVNDDPIDQLYRAFVSDLSTTLDLSAGSSDATLSRHFIGLIGYLRERLDLHRGLAAVIGQDEDQAEAPRATGCPEAVSDMTPILEPSWAMDLAMQLRQLQLDPVTRFDLRGNAAAIALRLCFRFTDAGLNNDGGDHGGELVTALEETVREWTDGSDDLARITLGCERAFRVALDRAVANANDVALLLHKVRYDFGYVSEETRSQTIGRAMRGINGLVMALTEARTGKLGNSEALNDAKAHVRNVATLMGSYDLNRSLAERARERVARFQEVIEQASVRPLALAGSLAPDILARECIYGISGLIARILGLSLALEENPKGQSIIGLRWAFDQILDDFVGADLRSLVLDGLPLDDVVWSEATQWPPEWEEVIRSSSVEIKPGIFRVKRRGRDDTRARANVRV